jgi:hypothetical protein
MEDQKLIARERYNSWMRRISTIEVEMEPGQISKTMGVNTSPAHKIEIAGFWVLIDPQMPKHIVNNIEMACMINDVDYEHSIELQESDAVNLGFKLVHSYKHDAYNTNRYKLWPIELEFTYEADKLVTCDITLEEINCLPVDKSSLKHIIKALKIEQE